MDDFLEEQILPERRGNSNFQLIIDVVISWYPWQDIAAYGRRLVRVVM